MSVKTLLLVSSLLIVGAIGCRDRPKDTEPAAGTGTAGDMRQDTEAVNPSGDERADQYGTQQQRGNVPSAAKPMVPSGAPGTPQQQAATPTEPTRVTPTEPVAATPRTLGKAELKASDMKSKTTGSATFSGDDAALTKVMIDVKDAPKGTYQVHVLDGSDCKAIGNMETPYAGGPGVAGEGKKGSPGPETTMALWQSLGTMTVDETGIGKIEVDVKNAEGAKLNQRVVVIYPEKGADKGKKQAIIACGPVKTEVVTEEGAG